MSTSGGSWGMAADDKSISAALRRWQVGKCRGKQKQLNNSPVGMETSCTTPESGMP